eukprot:5641203-Prymnesium_polylepis.1
MKGFRECLPPMKHTPNGITASSSKRRLLSGLCSLNMLPMQDIVQLYSVARRALILYRWTASHHARIGLLLDTM